MLEKILNLKKQYVEAQTDEQYAAIDREMTALIEQNPDAWAKAMCESANNTASKMLSLLQKVKLREPLDEALPVAV